MFILPTLRGSPRRGKQQSPTEQNNRLLLPGIWRVNKPKFLFRFRCSLLRAPLGLMESCAPGLTNWNFVLFSVCPLPTHKHTHTKSVQWVSKYQSFFIWTILSSISSYTVRTSRCGGLPSSLSGSCTLCCRPWRDISYRCV